MKDGEGDVAGARPALQEVEMEEVREPERSDNGWWLCPWEGCPGRWAPPYRENAAEHAARQHDLCTCGRFFMPESVQKHLAQQRRYGHDHPPSVRDILDWKNLQDRIARALRNTVH